MKNERQDETQFITKIGEKTSLGPQLFRFVKFSFPVTRSMAHYANTGCCCCCPLIAGLYDNNSIDLTKLQQGLDKVMGDVNGKLLPIRNAGPKSQPDMSVNLLKITDPCVQLSTKCSVFHLDCFGFVVFFFRVEVCISLFTHLLLDLKSSVVLFISKVDSQFVFRLLTSCHKRASLPIPPKLIWASMSVCWENY